MATETTAPVGAPEVTTPPVGEGAEIKLTSGQLKERLSESSASARKALLKDLGIESQEKLKERLDRLTALENEKLTVEERTKKELAELGERAKAADSHSTTAQAAVEALFATLTDAQKAAIEEQAPASAAEKLKLITFVRKLGGTAPALPAAPATTAPAAGAPKPSGVKTAFERWSEMKPNSFTRDAFYQSNSAAIEATRPSS